MALNASAASYTFHDLHEGNDKGIAQSINENNQIAARISVSVQRGDSFFVEEKPVFWDEFSPVFVPMDLKNIFNTSRNVINDSGDILISVNFKAAVWSTSTNSVNMLNDLGNGFSIGYDINDAGQIIGITGPGIRDSNPVEWKDPNSAPVNITQENKFFPTAINNNGQIVGSIISEQFNRHAAIIENNTITDLGSLGGNNSYVTDISNTGYVIGRSELSNGNPRSFIWKDGNMEMLTSFPDAIGSIYVAAVNDLGQSVGNVDFSAPGFFTLSHAILWNGTKPIDLNNYLDQSSKDEGWVLSTAFDINNNGWIVGSAFNTITKQSHAYVLSTDDPITPVPEPSIYLLLIGGLAVLGFVGRRKLQFQ